MDVEAELICKVLKAYPSRESEHPFGTPGFFNVGFQMVEQNDLVVCSVLINPEDLELCCVQSKELTELNIWTADVITSRHVPQGTAIFLPSPDVVGAFGITEDWRSIGNCIWTAEFSLLVQSGTIAWEKGRDPNRKEVDPFEVAGDNCEALKLFAQRENIEVLSISRLNIPNSTAYVLHSSCTDTVVRVKDGLVTYLGVGIN